LSRFQRLVNAEFGREKKPAQETPAPAAAPPESPLQSHLPDETTGVVSTPAVETTPVVSKKGFLRIPNEIIDNVLPTLRPPEQAVFIRLYRQSYGFNQNTCLISLTKLALLCRLSKSQTRIAVRNVEARGYIKQLKIEQGARERGILFEVWTPVETTPVKFTGVVSTGVETTPNKYKDLKDNYKREIFCPDCKNTGWYYPEGVAKGVRRCPHEKVQMPSG
jgi:hypothetical protein